MQSGSGALTGRLVTQMIIPASVHNVLGRKPWSKEGEAVVTYVKVAICMAAIGVGVFAGNAGAADPNHPVRSTVYWESRRSHGPLEERVALAPAEVIDYITRDNIANDWPQRPKATDPGAAFRADVRAALAELPAPVHDLLYDKLLAVVLLEDLGGTAYTEVVADRAGMPAAAFVALDWRTLDRTANDWATWRDGTPFAAAGDATARLTIATAERDDRGGAIQFILLHELGHVLSVGAHFHPPWGAAAGPIMPVCAYRYACISWRRYDPARGWISRFDKAWPAREEITFYGGPDTLLPAAARVAAYRALAETDLPSLYGATSGFEDFAESFAIYVHAVLLGKPYRIEVRQGGETVLTLDDCFSAGRCPDKATFFAALIDSVP